MRTKKTTQKFRIFKKMSFEEINKGLGERVEDLLVALQVDLIEFGDDYVGACPIHGGDGASAFRLHGPHHEYPLKFKCWSHSCDEHFGGGLTGLVRGVLSHQQCCWTGPGDEELPWKDFFEWVREFLGDTMPKNTIVKKESSSHVETPLWTELEYRKMFSTPSRYYIKRGFSEKVLSDYLVADSNQYGTLFKRAIIPIVKNRKIMGISSRSMLPECPKCNCHHQGVCPEPKDRHYPSYIRWAHKGFKKSNNLYNLEQSLDWIRSEKTAILVESPNSVLKLEDAGIPGSLATFGCKVSPGQLELLAQNNVERILMVFDGDRAGIEGARAIAEKFGKSFEFVFPEMKMGEGMDLADYPTEVVRLTMNSKLRREKYPI